MLKKSFKGVSIMKEFMKMAGAVTVGTLMASGVAVSVLLNKKVLKAYTKCVMSISNEITNELMKNDYND